MRTGNHKLISELVVITIILTISYFISAKIDAMEKIFEFSQKYEEFEVDEILSTLFVSVLCLLWFSLKRVREIRGINKDLRDALSRVKKLEGIIPICMYCKEIRDDKGAWNKIEKYITEHSDAKFSHTICEKCFHKHHPEAADKKTAGSKTG